MAGADGSGVWGRAGAGSPVTSVSIGQDKPCISVDASAPEKTDHAGPQSRGSWNRGQASRKAPWGRFVPTSTKLHNRQRPPVMAEPVSCLMGRDLWLEMWGRERCTILQILQSPDRSPCQALLTSAAR